MRIRNLALLFSLGVLCLAQGNWKTATDVNGVDFQGLSPAKREAALKFLREEGCTCGCNMKLAECRMADPSCGTSRKLSNVVVQDFGRGMSVEEIRADVKKIAGEPPPILEAPVKLMTQGDPVRGPQDAKVTLVEFSDFQCPFCSKAVSQANDLLKAFPKDLKLVFKEFPLDSHADAEFAAEAALAAHAQGKFWEMHDLMYAGFPDLSRGTILGYAKKISLDMNKFTSDVDSHKYKTAVRNEEFQGELAGVQGTPTFYINGKRYNGVFDVASVTPLIRNELK